MSGIFGSTVLPGNRLTDIVDQTSTVGIPIPFGYGKFEVKGNVIWATKHTEHVVKKRQGKGGTKTKEYTYTRSYAIGFCQKIRGYLTITRDGKVVYTTDPNATVEDAAYAAKWLEKATLYYGTDDQMPDSTIEAVEGAGQVSAFRNLAYVVLENDDVTSSGAAVPSYRAVVYANSQAYLTTPPYPIEDIEGIAGACPDLSARVLLPPMDAVVAGGGLVSAELTAPLITCIVPPEGILAGGGLPSGALEVVLVEYTIPPEGIESSLGIPEAELAPVLIPYTIEPEGIEAAGDIVGGTLDEP